MIRASALRVLSSIRVPIITTIMMLAIKEAVSDMSPYVRKTAANAITKLYRYLKRKEYSKYYIFFKIRIYFKHIVWTQSLKKI